MVSKSEGTRTSIMGLLYTALILLGLVAVAPAQARADDFYSCEAAADAEVSTCPDYASAWFDGCLDGTEMGEIPPAFCASYVGFLDDDCEIVWEEELATCESLYP